MRLDYRILKRNVKDAFELAAKIEDYSYSLLRTGSNSVADFTTESKPTEVHMVEYSMPNPPTKEKKWQISSHKMWDED